MSTGTLRVQSFAPRLTEAIPTVILSLSRSANDICSGTGTTTTPTNTTGYIVIPEGCSYSFQTDADGNAPDLTLPTPNPALTLDENNTIQPYSTWDLTAEKPGYQTITMQGIQLFGDRVTVVQLEMLPLQRSGAPTPDADAFVTPPHSLYQPISPSSTAPLTVEPRVLPEVVIPKNITVHLGKPAASAQNVTVTFRNYIANVASSEVYPNWVEQTKPTKFPLPVSFFLNKP